MMENKYEYLNKLEEAYPAAEKLGKINDKYFRKSGSALKIAGMVLIGLGAFLDICVLLDGGIQNLFSMLFHGVILDPDNLTCIILFSGMIVIGVLMVRYYTERLKRLKKQYDDCIAENQNKLDFLADDYWNADAFQYLYKLIDTDRVESWNEALNMTDIYLNHQAELQQLHDEFNRLFWYR